MLWLLYVSYLLLRTLVEEPDRRALLSALFGIFAFHRCAAGFWLDPLVADAASAAGGDGRVRLGLGADDVEGASIFVVRDAALDGAADARALSTGSDARTTLDTCAPGSGGGVKNLDSVFAAYLIGWGIFFVYYLTVARRTAALREEIERLKNSLNRGK